MQAHFLDPSKNTGFDGFMNYKLSGSGGDSGSNGGSNGNGCFPYILIGIIIIILSFIFK